MRFLRALFALTLTLFMISACVSADTEISVSSESISPGSQVLVADKVTLLYPGSLRIGDNFNQQAKDLSYEPLGAVVLISIVPSLDTSVCEAQTYQMGEARELHPSIKRAVISRDLPQAQQRFARDSGLDQILYYSDYKEGAFGKANGLLMKGSELLTRGLIVLDRDGIVRHLQLVPRIEQLPDLNKAIVIANSLVE